MIETECDSKPRTSTAAATTAAGPTTTTNNQNQDSIQTKTSRPESTVQHQTSTSARQCKLAVRKSSSLDGLASDTPPRGRPGPGAKSTRHCFSCGKWLASAQHPSPGAQQQRARILKHIRCLRTTSPLCRRLVPAAVASSCAPQPPAESELASSLSSLKYKLDPQHPNRKLLIEFGPVNSRTCQLEFERLESPPSQPPQVDGKSGFTYEFWMRDIADAIAAESQTLEHFQVSIGDLPPVTRLVAQDDADPDSSHLPRAESQEARSRTTDEVRLFLSPLPARGRQAPKAPPASLAPLEMKLKFAYLSATATTTSASQSRRILIENSAISSESNLLESSCNERALAGAVCLCHLAWLERVAASSHAHLKMSTPLPNLTPSVTTLCESQPSTSNTNSGGSSSSSSTSRDSSRRRSSSSSSSSSCSHAESCELSSFRCDGQPCRCSTTTGSACSLTSNSSGSCDQATCSSQSRLSSPSGAVRSSASSCCRHRRRRRSRGGRGERKRWRDSPPSGSKTEKEVAGGRGGADYANNSSDARGASASERCQQPMGHEEEEEEEEQLGYSNRNKLKNQPTQTTMTTTTTVTRASDHKFVDQPDRAKETKAETTSGGGNKFEAHGQPPAVAGELNSIIEIETVPCHATHQNVTAAGSGHSPSSPSLTETQTEANEPIVEQLPAQAAKLPAENVPKAPPKPPRRPTQPHFIEPQYLLNPMEFVFKGASGSPAGGGGSALESARAHSFTATSMSRESSCLVAQLAAAARSRSLCTEDQKAAELQRRLGGGGGGSSGRGARLVVKEKVENLTRRMSRLTRQAIDRLRTGFSASNPNLAPAGAGRNSLEIGDSTNTPKLRRGRFTSQRVADSARKRSRPPTTTTTTTGNIYLNSGKHELQIVPYWATSSGGGGGGVGDQDRKTTKDTCSGSALSLKIVNQDEQLLFAPGGVYVGGAGSWLESALANSGQADLCKPTAASQSPAVSAISRRARHSSCASPQVIVQAAQANRDDYDDQQQQPPHHRSAHAQQSAASSVVIRVGETIGGSGEHMAATAAAPASRCSKCHRCMSNDAGDASGLCSNCMSDGRNQISSSISVDDKDQQRQQQPRQRATSVGQCRRAATIELNAAVPPAKHAAARNQYFTFERCTSTKSAREKKPIERVSSDGGSATARGIATTSAKSTVTSQRHPSLPIDHRASQQQQQQHQKLSRNMSAANSRSVPPALVGSSSPSKPHHQNWLLSLTQRVGGGGGGGSSSPRRTSGHEAYLAASKKALATNDAKPGQLTQLRSSSPPPPPQLAKEARSSSLSGLYYQGQLIDLSKSSMELNFVAESLAEQTSLFLAELNDRFSSSSHELTPPPQATTTSQHADHPGGSNSNAWFKRHSKSVQSKTSGEQAAGPSVQVNDCNQQQQQQQQVSASERSGKAAQESESRYGANLQSACIHCQLIAELSSHPESSYLSQLVVVTRSLPPPPQETKTGNMKGPSLMVTTCSNQGTIDDDDDDGEANKVVTESECAVKEKSSQEIGDAPEASRRGSGASTKSNKRAKSGERRRAASMAIVIVDERGERRVHSGVSSPRRTRPLESAYSSTASLLAGSSSGGGGGIDGRKGRTRARKRRESSHSTLATTTTNSSISIASVAANATGEEEEEAQIAGYVELAGSARQSSQSSRSSSCSSSSSSSSSTTSAGSSTSTTTVNSSVASSLNSSGSSSSRTTGGVDGPPAPANMKTLEVPTPAGGSKQIRSNSLDAPYLMSAGGKSGSQSKLTEKANRTARRRRRRRKSRLSQSAQLVDENGDLLDYDDDDDEDYDDEEEEEDYEGESDGEDEKSSGDEESKRDSSLLQVAKAGKSNRSRSVDISLPTQPGESYGVREPTTATGASSSSSSAAAVAAAAKKNQKSAAVAQADELAESKMMLEGKSTRGGGLKTRWPSGKKLIQEEIRVPCGNGETRALKLFVDWDENCANGDHLWVYMGSSSEACYVGESECSKQGPRLSCSACKITAHTGCIGILTEKIKFICKHTFKDLTVSDSYHLKELQQQNVIYHHWVHKRTHCGRCKQCTKTIGNTKLPFSSKEIQAITCSWCKVSYHNKENCYTLSTLTEPCTLGAHRESIIPPSWILKLPPPPANSGGDVNRTPNHATTNSIAQQQQQPAASSFDIIRDQQHQPTVDELINLGSNQTLGSYNNNNSNNNNNNISSNIDSMNDDISNTKENIRVVSTLKQQQQQQQQQHQNHIDFKSSSNSTLTTDTSGYAVSLTTDNSISGANNKMNIQSEREIIMDPADLALINQANMRPCDHHLHHQERDIIRSSTNSLFDASHDTTSCYHNFKIVPQPISGVPNAGTKPVLVFVNPRSGGNQGAKMMQKFNWLLNPRQVFDLIQSNGPRGALELYRDVPNLRILTIGGDGTASWILSHLDDVGIPGKIPVAVLPLGTGNDLARALGWGGGYADEPIAKILAHVREGEVVQLDRWNLHVERNHEVVAPSSPNEFSSTGSSANIEFSSSPSINSAPSSSFYGGNNNNNNATASTVSIVDQQTSNNCDMAAAVANGQLDSETGTERLPMDVINNYFSFGVDAHIALEFHTAREAHPERFNSRLRNRMFYGQAGGKDLLKRKWKDLSNFVTLYCDGQDMTSRLKELKVHSVLFLNIPSYGGGTRPWPTTATAFAKPRTDDGLIEVIGLTTYQLPLLQAGGHGTCIAQCRSAKIITSRTIPMQVDGEPCNLLPSIININLKNRVCMLAKSKGGHPQKFYQ